MNNLQVIMELVEIQFNKKFKGDKVPINESGYEVRWTEPFTDDEIGYSLTYNCYDSGGIVNCSIINRTNRGFTVIPAAPAIFEYNCKKL